MVVIMITLIGIYYRTDDNNLFILFSFAANGEHIKCHSDACVYEYACVCHVAFRIELTTSKCVIIINSKVGAIYILYYSHIEPPQPPHQPSGGTWVKNL